MAAVLLTTSSESLAQVPRPVWAGRARPGRVEHCTVTVRVPPSSTQFWFWAFSRRVDPEY